MIRDWVWAVFGGLLATVIIVGSTIFAEIWQYNSEQDTKIQNAKTCDQVAMISGGVKESFNLLLCKLGNDFFVEGK